jgi:hypothetical protein
METSAKKAWKRYPKAGDLVAHVHAAYTKYVAKSVIREEVERRGRRRSN